MQPPEPPEISTVEVVPAEPTDADKAAMAQLSADSGRPLPEAVYVVKVRLKTKPEATSMAWRLYVGDMLIPKYWEYADGIYFTVLDPQFLSDHKGAPLRFSQDEVDFHDTGMKLAAPRGRATPSKSAAKSAKGRAPRLPQQADVLKQARPRSWARKQSPGRR